MNNWYKNREKRIRIAADNVFRQIVKGKKVKYLKETEDIRAQILERYAKTKEKFEILAKKFGY